MQAVEAASAQPLRIVGRMDGARFSPGLVLACKTVMEFRVCH